MMADATSFLNLLGGYILVVLLPLLALYICYLIISRAFREMGLSSWEAIVIVFVSFLLGSGLADGIAGIRFSDIRLFTYNTYWVVGINVGGALIPMLLSIYLSMKNRLQLARVFLGIILVAGFTYVVTYPDPAQGIVSKFPFWLVPVVCASILSVIFCWNNERKAAPFAYVTGTFGVLIGADLLHLFDLLSFQPHTTGDAVIGGASVFDMVFITGLLAVVLDSFFLYKRKRKADLED